MEKTATLNLRVNPAVKQQAEAVLLKLGVSMSTAVDIYLRQITLTGGIPFMVSLPKAPSENAEEMSAQELRAKLQKGVDDIELGKVQKASTALKRKRAENNS